MCDAAQTGVQQCLSDGTFADCECRPDDVGGLDMAVPHDMGSNSDIGSTDASGDIGSEDLDAADVQVSDAAQDVGDGQDVGGMDIGIDAGSDAAMDVGMDTGTPCGAAGAVLGCEDSATELVCVDGTNVTSVPCEVGDGCSVIANRCQAHFCAPGAMRCIGLESQQCDPSGARWEPVESCAADCVAGVCTCDLLPDNCPATQKCMDGPSGHECVSVGTKTEGDDCVTGECVRGLLCAVGETGKCEPICDVSAPQCGFGTLCEALSPASDIGLCLPDPCFDGVVNGIETGLDCGGSCLSCPDNSACQVAADCRSLICSGSSCNASGCSDGQKNGDETGVDCGGSCNECAPGSACQVDDDCWSGSCVAGVCEYTPRAN